jgi:hypothetical protein
MNLDRIERLARTPRVLDESVDKIRERPMFFMRAAVRTWECEMRTAPLVFAYVVSAESALFEVGDGGTGRAVLLHSREPGYSRNARWLGELSERLWALRMARAIPDRAVLELATMLVDDQSEFSLPVPLSLTQLVLAHLSTQTLNAALLPDACIPHDRVIPALALPKALFPIPAEMWE